MQNFERLTATLNTPVIPVIALEDANLARPLAEALVEGGLHVLEVTFRTAAAEAVMREMAKVEGAVVGAGTVRNSEHLRKAVDLGCKFAVSPGFTPQLMIAAKTYAPQIDLLPGIETTSEAMAAAEKGYKFLKFFPAESIGGVKKLRALQGPLSELKFCATGGITEANAQSYLELSNVANVGGTWMIPKDAIEAQDFRRITQLARQAAALRAAPG